MKKIEIYHGSSQIVSEPEIRIAKLKNTPLRDNDGGMAGLYRKLPYRASSHLRHCRGTNGK